MQISEILLFVISNIWLLQRIMYLLIANTYGTWKFSRKKDATRKNIVMQVEMFEFHTTLEET